MKNTYITKKIITSALTAIILSGTFGTIVNAESDAPSPEFESITEEGVTYTQAPSVPENDSRELPTGKRERETTPCIHADEQGKTQIPADELKIRSEADSELLEEIIKLIENRNIS